MPMPASVSPLNVPSHSMLHGFHANVKAFGAVGDGVTDERVAIQAAIDTGAGIVHFPPGTYKLADGSSLTFHGTQILQGSGRRTSVITSQNAYALSAPA